MISYLISQRRRLKAYWDTRGRMCMGTVGVCGAGCGTVRPWVRRGIQEAGRSQFLVTLSASDPWHLWFLGSQWPEPGSPGDCVCGVMSGVPLASVTEGRGGNWGLVLAKRSGDSRTADGSDPRASPAPQVFLKAYPLLNLILAMVLRPLPHLCLGTVC